MPFTQLGYNINVLAKHLCCNHFQNELQFILHLNHPDFNRSKLFAFSIIFEQRTLFIVHCRIHNRIVLSLFSCSYLSLHIVRETVPQIHGIFSPISWYLFKLKYLLDQCFSNHTVQSTHSMWETQIEMMNWGIERPPNLPKLCSWEESQWELAPET